MIVRHIKMDGYCKEYKPVDKDIRRDRGREIEYSKQYKCFLFCCFVLLLLLLLLLLLIGHFILMQK